MANRWTLEDFAKAMTKSHARVRGGMPTEAAPAPSSGGSVRVGRKTDRLQGLPLLVWQLSAAGVAAPVRELRFHPERDWRADLAWPNGRLIVEYEGGVHTGGRHVRGEGFERDIEKYNAALLLGWRVLRCTHDTVESGRALDEIMQALGHLPADTPAAAWISTEDAAAIACTNSSAFRPRVAAALRNRKADDRDIGQRKSQVLWYRPDVEELTRIRRAAKLSVPAAASVMLAKREGRL